MRKKRQDETASDDAAEEAPEAPAPPTTAAAAPPPAVPTSYVIPGMEGQPPPAASVVAATPSSMAPAPSPSGTPVSAEQPTSGGPNMPLIISLTVVLVFLFIVLPLCILLVLVVRHRMRRAERRRRKALSREMRRQQDEYLIAKDLSEADEWDKGQFAGREPSPRPSMSIRSNQSGNNSNSTRPDYTGLIPNLVVNPPSTGDIADIRGSRRTDSDSSAVGRKKSSSSKKSRNRESGTDTNTASASEFSTTEPIDSRSSRNQKPRQPPAESYDNPNLFRPSVEADRSESEVQAMLSDLTETARSKSPVRRDAPPLPVPSKYGEESSSAASLNKSPSGGSKVGNLGSMFEN